MLQLSDNILDLYSKGFSYNQISERLSCSKGTISYHVGKGQKEKTLARTATSRSNAHPLMRKAENFQLSVRPPARTIPSIPTKKKQENKIANFVRKGRKGLPAERFTFKDVVEKAGETPVCYLTGDPIDLMSPDDYQLDHIVPRSKGGSNGLENVGLATAAANKAKHDMPLDEFLDLCEKVLRNHGRL